MHSGKNIGINDKLAHNIKKIADLCSIIVYAQYFQYSIAFLSTIKLFHFPASPSHCPSPSYYTAFCQQPQPTTPTLPRIPHPSLPFQPHTRSFSHNAIPTSHSRSHYASQPLQMCSCDHICETRSNFVPSPRYTLTRHVTAAKVRDNRVLCPRSFLVEGDNDEDEDQERRKSGKGR